MYVYMYILVTFAMKKQKVSSIYIGSVKLSSEIIQYHNQLDCKNVFL